MRVAVFGATGRTGRLVATRARDRGHDVVALVRAAPDLAIDGASSTRVVALDDIDDIAAAVAGVDGVVWAVGPVAGVTRTEVSDALATTIEGMRSTGVRRVVATANGSVLHDREVTGEFANVAAEHRRNVSLLRASGSDWTVLAAPFLTDDDPSGDFVTVVDAKAPARELARADLATAVVDALERADWVGHIVGVSNRPAD